MSLKNVNSKGLHAFNAEANDELTFSVGDSLLVLEKDDMYNDGWWIVSELSLLTLSLYIFKLSNLRVVI